MKASFTFWTAVSALVICLLTLGIVINNTISNRYESGYMARVLEEFLEVHSIQEQNTELLRVYVESLRQDMLKKGFEPPPMPKVLKTKPVPELRKRLKVE